MISFRYHIFTIVAIFLAVGLGVLMGTSVVQPALIDNLERQVGDLKRDPVRKESRGVTRGGEPAPAVLS